MIRNWWDFSLGMLAGTFLVVALVLMSAHFAKAQDVVWHNANQFTVEWNAVEHDSEWELRYEVILAPWGERQAWFVAGTVEGTSAVVTLQQRGLYHVGVRAAYAGWDAFVDEWGDEYDPAWDALRFSPINWGDEPEYQEGYELFAMRWGMPLPRELFAPPGLRR